MENPNFAVDYTGNLMTSATHLFSGTTIVTDAPLDNNGKASSFSPTDLVAAALSSCMLTIIGIHLDKQGITLKPVRSRVKKLMTSNPRRIGEIQIEFNFGENNFTKEELEQLERIGHACPVAKSLGSDVVIKTSFI